MANSIALAEKFQPILDDIYKLASATARMDGQSKPVDHSNAQVVKVFKTSLVGMGDYARNTGFPAGDVTGTWETLTLAKDRGRAFSVDAMDNEETIGMAFGTLVGEFIRTMVVPEIDAYRFDTYASWSGITSPSAAALTTGTAVLAAVDVAQASLDGNEVPREGRILYCSDSIYHLLKGALSRQWASEGGVSREIFSLDGMEVVMVPQTRFYKGITLDAGASSAAGGYSKTTETGRDINFMLIHPSAVLQVAKHNPLRVFSPETNQTADAWLFQYRIYHDAFVYDNKVKGVYAHVKNS
jgi:hypothetical protein